MDKETREAWSKYVVKERVIAPFENRAFIAGRTSQAQTITRQAEEIGRQAAEVERLNRKLLKIETASEQMLKAHGWVNMSEDEITAKNVFAGFVYRVMKVASPLIPPYSTPLTIWKEL